MRALLLVILLISFSYVVAGQSRSTSAPLQLSVQTKEGTICLGGRLNFLVKLTNIGKSPIAIDANRAGSETYFERFVDGTKEIDPDGSVVLGDFLFLINYKPKFIVLQPNQTFATSRTVDIKAEAFTKWGRYGVQIGYEQTLTEAFEGLDIWQGQINSNTVSVLITKCSR